MHDFGLVFLFRYFMLYKVYHAVLRNLFWNFQTKSLPLNQQVNAKQWFQAAKQKSLKGMPHKHQLLLECTAMRYASFWTQVPDMAR